MVLKKSDNNLCVNTWAIRALRQGRELGEQVAAMRDAPTGDLPSTILSATLRRLAVGEVTDGRDLVVFEALQAGLTERLLLEIIGTSKEYIRDGYDEDGQEVWASKEVPNYSDRGEEARCVKDCLQRFLELRRELIDRANAERIVRHLLR